MSALNQHQLGDITKLWKEYDPNAQGFINYKDFWKYSSQVAIIFGVAYEEILDYDKKKVLLKSLKLPIYENMNQDMFAYQFHDAFFH